MTKEYVEPLNSERRKQRNIKLLPPIGS